MMPETIDALIRLAREEDLDICGKIYAAAFAGPPYFEAWKAEDAAEMLGEILKKDPENSWCVEVEGEVAGFCFCSVFGRFHAFIQEFAISPGHQKNGLGTALMEHVLAHLKGKGVHSAELVVNRRAPAFKLYRKFGFSPPRWYVLLTRWL